MERGQIVALPTQVIPPENTPEKTRSDTLIAEPHWKYVGPGETIRFEWQIGRWGWAGFAGETVRKSTTRTQPSSSELKGFYTSLPAIPLSLLSPGYYDCEIWFKDKFPDLRVIVQNCVRVMEEAPPPRYTLEVTVEPPGAGEVKAYEWGVVVPIKSSYEEGEEVYLAATPSSGYKFDHWGGWPSYPYIGSTSPMLRLVMKKDLWVVASFKVT